MSITKRIRAWSALTAITVAGTALAGPQVRAEAAIAPHQGIDVSVVGSYWLPFGPGPKSSLTALRVEIAPDGFTVRRGDRGFLLGYVLAGPYVRKPTVGWPSSTKPARASLSTRGRRTRSSRTPAGPSRRACW
jgi:hypothetical protein